jgi:hypothetical protein
MVLENVREMWTEVLSSLFENVLENVREMSEK